MLNRILFLSIILVLTSFTLQSPGVPLTTNFVTATIYQGVGSQTDETPTVTASGKKFDPIAPPRWIAVSQDLLDVYPFGSIIKLSKAGIHNGYYRVEDVMHFSKRNSIDILVSSLITKKDAQYGKWHNVQVTLVSF